MMGALIRALTNNAVENIEEALGMTDATSSAMKHAICTTTPCRLRSGSATRSGRHTACAMHRRGARMNLP